MRLLSSTLALLLWGRVWGRKTKDPQLEDPVPLTEYYSRTLKDYKGLKWDTITPETAAPMLRFRNIEEKEFNEVVRKGYPFIVEDCVPPDDLLRRMPCSEYSRQWPDEHMWQEYAPGRHDISLSDEEWHTVQKPTVTAKKHLSRGKPLSGPYIWKVQDKRELAKTFPLPYFLNVSLVNTMEAFDSFEFEFVLENGGRQARTHASCKTTVHMQLRGKKTWRLGSFPNITNAFQPNSFPDGKIYQHDDLWNPEYEELVEPGQCVVLPVGYVHETYVREGDAGEDGCSVASSFQLLQPQPVYQWKSFLARWGLSQYTLDPDLDCLDGVVDYLVLGSKQAPPAKRGEYQEVLYLAGLTFGMVDKNRDDFLSTSELRSKAVVLQKVRDWTGLAGKPLEMAKQESFVKKSRDILATLDRNRDGKISLIELQTSMLDLNSVDYRRKMIEKFKGKPSRLLSKERSWIKAHMCNGNPDCSYLKQLDRDFRARSRDGTLLKMIKAADDWEEEDDDWDVQVDSKEGMQHFQQMAQQGMR